MSHTFMCVNIHPHPLLACLWMPAKEALAREASCASFQDPQALALAAVVILGTALGVASVCLVGI